MLSITALAASSSSALRLRPWRLRMRVLATGWKRVNLGCELTYLFVQLRDLSQQVANHHLNLRRLLDQPFLCEMGRHAIVLTQSACSSPDRCFAVVRLGGAPIRERLPSRKAILLCAFAPLRELSSELSVHVSHPALRYP